MRYEVTLDVGECLHYVTLDASCPELAQREAVAMLALAGIPVSLFHVRGWAEVDGRCRPTNFHTIKKVAPKMLCCEYGIDGVCIYCGGKKANNSQPCYCPVRSGLDPAPSAAAEALCKLDKTVRTVPYAPMGCKPPKPKPEYYFVVEYNKNLGVGFFESTPGFIVRLMKADGKEHVAGGQAFREGWFFKESWSEAIERVKKQVMNEYNREHRKNMEMEDIAKFHSMLGV